jgi:hypothetical protein
MWWTDIDDLMGIPGIVIAVYLICLGILRLVEKFWPRQE